MLCSDAVHVCKASEVKLPEKRVVARGTPKTKTKPGRKRKIREEVAAPSVDEDLYDDAVGEDFEAAQNEGTRLGAIASAATNTSNKFLGDTYSQSSEDPELDNLGAYS